MTLIPMFTKSDDATLLCREKQKSLLLSIWRGGFSLKPLFFLFLVSYVGERPWWPIQCLNKERKRKAKRRERSDQVY